MRRLLMIAVLIFAMAGCSVPNAEKITAQQEAEAVEYIDQLAWRMSLELLEKDPATYTEVMYLSLLSMGETQRDAVAFCKNELWRREAEAEAEMMMNL
jgi:hypothetical protein